ncbi:hypothetical protein CO648_11825 [Rhizobium phaseoli]|nr:hypothetical protein CO648_11825 [Rhizobium phaseoli]
MQLLQAEFDQSRGFQQLPFSAGSLDGQTPISFGDKLSMAEFAAIGLGGEVGELLNGLKKVRRDLALKGIETPSGKYLQEEIADVYSYLLKLSNVLGYDLEIAYMEKVCLNMQRFPPLKAGSRPVLIVAGPPGCGKSSVTSGLLKTPGHVAYVENFSQNPFLMDAILRGESVFESQEWFIDQLRRFFEQPVNDKFLTVVDQAPLAIPFVYGRDFYASDKLTKRDYLSHLQSYYDLQEQLEGLASTVFTVYLSAEFETLINRCSTKGFVDREWLARIVERFELIRELSDVCIDTTNLSVDDVVLKVASLMTARG